MMSMDYNPSELLDATCLWSDTAILLPWDQTNANQLPFHQSLAPKSNPNCALGVSGNFRSHFALVTLVDQVDQVDQEFL